MRITVAFLFVLLVAPILITPHVLAVDYTVSTISLSIDPDGYANLEYKITTDTTVANITLPLIGSGYTNLLITDKNQEPLNFQIQGETATISSLGSNVDLSYSTHSLTSKTGDLWEMNFTAPTSVSVLLPQNATLVSLSQIPVEVGMVNLRKSLLLPDGPNEVTYELGVVSTKESSLQAINDAEAALNQAKTGGLIVISVETLLAKAQSYYNVGDFSSAVDYAVQVKTALTAITALASYAKAAISNATNSINVAKSGGRTNGLDEASTLLEKAKTSYTSGNYTEASSVAQQSTGIADKAAKPVSNLGPTPILFAGVVMVGLGVAVMVLRRRPGDKA